MPHPDPGNPPFARAKALPWRPTASPDDAPASPASDGAGSSEDTELVAGLRAGDEAAFARLIDKYSPALLRLAMVYVPNREAAEDVVQETWMGVLQGLERFEGRSSFKTWLFRILTNRAMTRGKREARTIPFSALERSGDDDEGRSVEPERIAGSEEPRTGSGAASQGNWAELPEERLLSGETLAVVRSAIEALPENQRNVITLRDIEHWTSDEVCNAMGITETNQRVLLHRARTKVRKALEQYFESGR